jgi:hypothetical protein
VGVKVQAYEVANVGQRGVDGVGECQIVQHMLLPVVVAGEQTPRLVAPVLGHARAVKGDHPAEHM